MLGNASRVEGGRAYRMVREEDELVRHENGSPDEGDKNPDASLCQDCCACKLVRDNYSSYQLPTKNEIVLQSMGGLGNISGSSEKGLVFVGGDCRVPIWDASCRSHGAGVR
jgi:hypothetical protein